MLFYEAGRNASDSSEKRRIEQMAREFCKSTIGVGCTDLGLDRILHGNPDKEIEFLSFVNFARNQLDDFGGKLPVEYVDKVIAIYEPDYRGKILGSPWFYTVLGIIEALIRGSSVPPIDWSFWKSDRIG